MDQHSLLTGAILVVTLLAIHISAAPQSNVLFPTDPQRTSPSLNYNDINDDDVTIDDDDDVEVEDLDEEMADHESMEDVIEELFTEQQEEINERFQQAEEHHESTEDSIGSLARQMMLQQLYLEERTRSEGQSGVKQMRVNYHGTRPYYAPHHSGKVMLSMHDHSNNERTVGLGEFSAVLNGVEFRTRHNDYRLRMPHRTSQAYDAIENIPLPDIPPEVLNKKSIGAQIDEMREWFKAFRKQDREYRDYTKYFKPVLCYLEGAWTHTNDRIDESFPSDRHALDAKTWFDMQEKIRFTSYTGRKSRFENYAYLPTTIIDIVNKTHVKYAQWNYKILCHPLKDDLPTKYLRLVDDLAPRLALKKKPWEFKRTRAARFQLYNVPSKREQMEYYSLLDQLMSEIPGKNNYPAKVLDNSFGYPAMDVRHKNNIPLNAGYYHRWFKVAASGAMGLQRRHRGFSDENLFVAFNTQNKIAGVNLTECSGYGKNRKCKHYFERVSYAIPLEIIYLTPLAKWNPYDIEYKGDFGTYRAKSVTKGRRNGGLKVEKAYNGTNSKVFYQTPAEFFEGNTIHKDPADTTKVTVGVLDKKGNVRRMRASGVRIFLPNISRVGIMRQRYPIMPVHGEGSAVWKELEALKDMVMEMNKLKWLYRKPPMFCNKCSAPKAAEPTAPAPTTTPTPPSLTLSLERSQGGNVSPHSHVVNLSMDEYKKLHKGDKIIKYTSENNGHSHQLGIIYTLNDPIPLYKMVSCDGMTSCWDKHGSILPVVESMRLAS